MDNKIQNLPRTQQNYDTASERQIADIKSILQILDSDPQKVTDFNKLLSTDLKPNLQASLTGQSDIYSLLNESHDLKIAKIINQGQTHSRFYAGLSIGPLIYCSYLLKDQTPKYRVVLLACIPLVYLRFKRYEYNRIEAEINENNLKEYNKKSRLLKNHVRILQSIIKT